MRKRLPASASDGGVTSDPHAVLRLLRHAAEDIELERYEAHNLAGYALAYAPLCEEPPPADVLEFAQLCMEYLNGAFIAGVGRCSLPAFALFTISQPHASPAPSSVPRARPTWPRCGRQTPRSPSTHSS